MESKGRHVDQSEQNEHTVYDVASTERQSFIRMSADSGNLELDDSMLGHSDAEYEDQREYRAFESPQNMASRWFNNRRQSFSMMTNLLMLCLWVDLASAVLLNFDNCLPDSYLNSDPLLLQFVPEYLDAVFPSSDPDHNLNITVWGNVTGSGPNPPFYLLPTANDTYWTTNSTASGGKIANIAKDGFLKATTLFNKVNVLTYEPWDSTENFCGTLLNRECPISPVFNPNSTQFDLPSFSIAHSFFSSYVFTTFTATMLIKNGDPEATTIGCISANITPDIGSRLSSIMKFMPLVVLIMVGLATAFAAIYSPWGTTDIFHWTTNYGRDGDLLRLVTPGFGDCLQYLQFVVLTGGLTLDYPGFYQPVVSKASWSSLMFNQSFVTGGTPYPSVRDGIYATNATHGLDVMRQLVGMSSVTDMWAGMVIWLLVIIAAVMAIILIGFLLRWVNRLANQTYEEDLRAKNIPFSMGNVIRIVFNYFLLPAVALSMFQLMIAGQEPSPPVFIVALAVLVIVVIIGFAVWLFYVIASTRPKSVLFDDLPTVLLYGALYNTYSDNAAPFALVPILLTFVRGIAIGAVQPSGIAQLVILAICEVITVLTLHAFRPFHSPTSMNAYHTFFAVLRGTSVLLMVAFAPSLGVTDGSKGWVGYAILLMHAMVLIFAFLFNALQTIIEVAARMAGAGDNNTISAARGGLSKVFGMRQLSKRLPRGGRGSRQSRLSTAAMLDNDDNRKSYVMDTGRFRSQSAGSTGILLHRQSTGFDNNMEGFSVPPHMAGGTGPSSYTPTTPGEASTFSFLPSGAPASLGRDRGAIIGKDAAETSDPYYRPPRIRRPTIDNPTPAERSRSSLADGSPELDLEQGDTFEGPSISGRVTPVQHQAMENAGSSPDAKRSQADYTVRESDFYYGVRGPALNANVPGRRIKTGPADPTGLPASAAGWFKAIFGGKTKEKNKGFEVVRSSRMPPGMIKARNGPAEAGVVEGLPVATEGVRNGPIDSDDEQENVGSPSRTTKAAAPTRQEDENLVSPMVSGDEDSDSEDYTSARISEIPPILPGIAISSDDIELPGRFPSKTTTRNQRAPLAGNMVDVPIPEVRGNSSRRKSHSVDMTARTDYLQAHTPQRSVDSSRLPFERTSSGRHSTVSAKSSTSQLEDSNLDPPTALGHVGADTSNDRPGSMGYVPQHHIRTVTPVTNPQFLGSQAELVDGRHSGASSMEGQAI
ncbi:integral membrane protein-like protein [Calycina marina]|uniref:Integral membrane protein-like protein n=1 Tax=Calycina marina TaxID=1763456 RepID=A0A9P7ZAJ8_9HELO|nr:integral membrane protein-like protein [Calycina marina]